MFSVLQAKLKIVLAVAEVASATSLASLFKHFAMHLTITGNVQGSLIPSHVNSRRDSLTGSNSDLARFGIMYGASLWITILSSGRAPLWSASRKALPCFSEIQTGLLSQQLLEDIP